MQTVKEATASVVEGAKGVAEKLVGDSHDQKAQEDTQEKVKESQKVEEPGETDAVQEAVAGLEDVKERKRKHGDVLGNEPATEKMPDKEDEKDVQKASAADAGLKELERLERNVEKENEAAQDELTKMSNDNKRAKPNGAVEAQGGDQE
ncbi:hypothetical protein KFL_000230440 [Klebsormidium nitens]|uniref:Uncharacterized protein n=1 Tax=Klebsormidium nitens TaxID=105231 RepID=A0A1Y1HR49_KLENI|nr:hypothetical protein KFL_000230440 [Klebsormidium nitens]|eukprot:GAQ79066.1 hypothetical protein KFL_000230440 [Klebsormidium nitens]